MIRHGAVKTNDKGIQGMQFHNQPILPREPPNAPRAKPRFSVAEMSQHQPLLPAIAGVWRQTYSTSRTVFFLTSADIPFLVWNIWSCFHLFIDLVLISINTGILCFLCYTVLYTVRTNKHDLWLSCSRPLTIHYMCKRYFWGILGLLIIVNIKMQCKLLVTLVSVFAVRSFLCWQLSVPSVMH